VVCSIGSINSTGYRLLVTDCCVLIFFARGAPAARHFLVALRYIGIAQHPVGLLGPISFARRTFQRHLHGGFRSARHGSERIILQRSGGNSPPIEAQPLPRHTPNRIGRQIVHSCSRLYGVVAVAGIGKSLPTSISTGHGSHATSVGIAHYPGALSCRHQECICTPTYRTPGQSAHAWIPRPIPRWQNRLNSSARVSGEGAPYRKSAAALLKSWRSYADASVLDADSTLNGLD